ncbi:50S ribosomal protein L22 [Candidatus Dojkabacteria bacterium]|nr:50S ribosomal protein L22 [Candidatus Dojkabacteria bacterium]
MDQKVVKAQTKNVQVTPQKLRLVADVVRGMSAQKALDVLKFLNKKGALHIRKTLATAVANAKDLFGAEVGAIEISKLTVDEGVKYRRPKFGSRGRVSMLHKRRSNINLEVKVK